MEIVCLQDGNSSTVAYCVPTVAGTVEEYFELAKTIGPGHLVYGIQFADRQQNGKFKKFASLQEMAAAMVPDLLAHHRDGPICLFGCSFSALLAMELAQQLVAHGRLVPLVMIIAVRGPSDSFTPFFRIKHFIKNVGPWALRVATRAVTDSNYRNAIIHKLNLHRKSVDVNRLHKFVGASWYENLPEDYQDYVTNNDANLRNYRFEGSYRGKILLFRARPLAGEYTHPLRISSEDLGWGGATGATVDVRYFSDFYSVLQHPEVIVIANALRQALNECDQTVSINRLKSGV